MAINDDQYYALNYATEGFNAAAAPQGSRKTVIDSLANTTAAERNAQNKTIVGRRNAEYAKFLAGTAQFKGNFVPNVQSPRGTNVTP